MNRRSLKWISADISREELEARYDEWGRTYDQDLMDIWNYKLPSLIGDLLMKYVEDRDARILDAGVGTGLGGECIHRNGYSNLYGIDMSRGMLQEALSKEIYQKLDRMILGEKLDFSDDYFDTTLSIGTIGHAPPESFDEMIRITKPSGFIIFSLQTTYYDEPRFHERQQALEDEGKWKLVERTTPILALPGEASDVYYYCFVYEVL